MILFMQLNIYIIYLINHILFYNLRYIATDKIRKSFYLHINDNPDEYP